MKRIILIKTMLFLLMGCSSTPQHDQSIKVIARIDGLTQRPNWVKESEPFYITNGKVTVLGKQTITSQQNLEQAFRSAELNAKAHIAQAIEQKIQVAFQNAEEGFDGDSQARFVGMIATEVLHTSAINSSGRYWEKYVSALDAEPSVSKIDAFVKVEMPEKDFKQAVIAAIRKQHGKKNISQEFAKKVDAQWNQIMETSSSVGREPGSDAQ
jgi:hypothetical protein